VTAHPRPEARRYRVAGPGEARTVRATSPAHARQIVAAGRVGYVGYEVRLATPEEIAAAKRRLAWGWT
jgi:hypothetical protein